MASTLIKGSFDLDVKNKHTIAFNWLSMYPMIVPRTWVEMRLLFIYTLNSDLSFFEQKLTSDPKVLASLSVEYMLQSSLEFS